MSALSGITLDCSQIAFGPTAAGLEGVLVGVIVVGFRLSPELVIRSIFQSDTRVVRV